MAVLRLGFVHIRVTDMQDAVKHYRDTLGMKIVAEEGGKIYLKAWDEFDHHSLVLEEGGVGLVKLGYKVESDDDLAQIEQRAQQFGGGVERVSAGTNLTVGEAIACTLPSEQRIEFYKDIELVGSETGDLNPHAWPRDMVGVGVPAIDHALIAAEDPLTVERWWKEVVDFYPVERVVTEQGENEQLIGSWLSCAQKAHDIALIGGPNGKIHHFAFHMRSWEDILKAADLFSMDDVPIDIGPTRHGITRGTTVYFFDPSGNRNETFAGGYTAYRDMPTITWTADQLGRGIFYHDRELNERFTTVFT